MTYDKISFSLYGEAKFTHFAPIIFSRVEVSLF